MATLITQSSISIIDLTDRGSLSGYINTNQPRVQIYDSIQDEYSPDYTQSPYLVLTPLIFIDGSQLSLIDSHLNLIWKRKIGNTEYDLVSGETVAGGILTISKNVLNSTTPYIIYVLHVQYTEGDNGYTIETILNSDISLVTSGDIGNSVVFTLYAPEGTVFTNGQGSRRIQTSAYYGSTVISNAIYKWYNYISGTWNLIPNETDDHLIVYGSDISGQGSFKCVMTYQGMDYTDVMTLIDKTDNYQIDIDSTSGNMMKNSSGDTYLVARLYQNGSEIDNVKCPYTSFGELPPSNPNTGDFYHKELNNSSNMPLMRYDGTTWVDVTNNDNYKYEKIYKWYRRDKDGEPLDNGISFAEGKVIHVDNNLVDNKCTFVCEVENEESGPIITTGNYTIIDVNDPVISSSQPTNPSEGMLWVDTSVTPNIIKIYKNGEWSLVGASDENKNKIFTITPVTPYKVGDLWVGRSDGKIYVCNNARESGNLDLDDWIPASDYQTSSDITDELNTFTENVIDPLASKVDSKIETWLQSSDPAISWTTTSERLEHVGDIWYDNTTNNVGLSRYTLKSSDPYVFDWEEIKNQDAIDALDGLDGKITTYSQNDPPTGSNLVDGDLWIDTNNNNKLYRYNGTEWVAVTDNSGLQNFISTTYSQNLSQLKNSIDSKIETWFQNTDPSVSWYDSTTTPITDNRSAHIGDIWFDNTPNKVKLQRYTYSLATGYIWQEITNQEAINAYLKAQDAEDLADSKRRVFYGTSNPVPPYDKGDLWAQGDEGSLLVCITSKEVGKTYSEDDWGDASRYDQFMDVTYVQDTIALQRQIDGKIQTWFQDLDPESYAGIMSFTSSNPDLSIGINGDQFETSDRQSGNYVFTYNGSSWELGTTTVSLGAYGISVVAGTPVNGDTITVVFQKPEDDVPWTTAVKSKHNGDLWYSPSTKVLKRYRDYGSNVFGWELIQDSDAIQALADAATAQSTADGKCMSFFIKNVINYTSSSGISASIVESEWNNAVYESGTYIFSYDGTKWILNSEEVNLSDYGIRITGDPVYGSTVTVNYTFNHPNPPYDVGDIWVQGDSGEILVCRTSKTAGQLYSWNDWEYGNALNQFINVTYKEDLLNLEGLIDNKIESWFQVSSPSTTWITSDLKRAHVGDIWYQDTNHIYRYSDDYTWIAVTDSATLTAYRNAASAYDTKDGKRRVFIGPNNPVPPYDRGDLWMQGDSGGILYCNIAKIDGASYAEGDFVTASKYKDYQIHIGPTAPSDTSLMWLDTTNPSKPVLKQCADQTASTPVWVVVGDTVNFYTGSTPPTPPYNAGDVWIYLDSSGNAVYKICVTTRSTGSYDADDWVEDSVSANFIERSETAPTDTSKMWYNITNNILYIYNPDTNEWVEVGDLSTVANITNKNNVSIISLNKNMSRVLDATYGLNIISSKESINPSLDKDLWINGNSDGSKSPSPYTNVYGNLIYVYDSAKWSSFRGYKSGDVVSGEMSWGDVKSKNFSRSWGYYSKVCWRKRFQQDDVVGTNGTKQELEDIEYISYSGSVSAEDTITITNYSTNTALGFVVEDYYEEYAYVEGELTSIGNKVEVIATAFSFESDGLHIYDGRQSVTNPSELILGHSEVTLGYQKGGSPDVIIDHDGVTAHRLISDGYIDVKNTIILGDYKIDCSTSNRTPGITVSYSPRS